MKKPIAARYWLPAMLAVMLLPPALHAAVDEDDAILSLGQEYTGHFLEGRFDVLWERMNDEMRQVVGSPEGLAQLSASLEEQAGPEVAVLSESVQELAGLHLYVRIAGHQRLPIPLMTQWVFNADHEVVGFAIQPVQEPAESRFLDYETQAPLRLPFDGVWTVFWGGRLPQQNYHVIEIGQRFATDFVVVVDGSTYTGDGSAPENYHCWDRPILAPAAGSVVSVVNDLPDRQIGDLDLENPAGNHVVLDLGNDEYAFLAHLREGSVTVAPGDSVESGAEIGRCGNSGNTSEPHLHFHLQNTPVLGEGEGLPAFFNDYLADDEPVARGEPVQGQQVAPRAPGNQPQEAQE